MTSQNNSLPNVSLADIKSPEDLKGLSIAQLESLAQQIRDQLCRLIETRSVHFASNMGVVELTLALHTVFDFTKDRLVWDVGHQTYPHKMVTGRYDKMSGIRTKGGLMGYPNPEESPFDLFMTGHAGVSVSTALGLFLGDELMRPEEGRKAVAVVGDGAAACGVIFEALNNASGLNKNIIVILNDNEMSICPRVGGLGRYLDGLRTNSVYKGVKNKVKSAVTNLPVIGKPLHRGLHNLKNAVKKGLVGGALFEELGFHYIGPVNGHDIRDLQVALNQAKRHDQPVLLHIFTQKGHGFHPAEEDPARFHAPPKVVYDDNGKMTLTKSQQVSYTNVASAQLYQQMLLDKRICVICAAMAQGNGLEKIREDFPDRFFDVGICESHAVAMAAGMAKAGLRPVVDIYSTFMQRAYDQIFHEISLQNLPVVLMMDRAGLVGADGPTHHGSFDMAYIRHLPNMTLCAPGCAEDLQEMIPWAINFNGPVSIRYPKDGVSHISSNNPVPIQPGVAEFVNHNADDKLDGLVIVCGGVLGKAIEAVTNYENKAVQSGNPKQIGLVNARWIKPLDERIAQWIQNAPWTLTIEDGCRQGGFGSAVLEELSDKEIFNCRVKRLGVGDHYVSHATRCEQLAEEGLDAVGIEKAIAEMTSSTKNN